MLTKLIATKSEQLCVFRTLLNAFVSSSSRAFKEYDFNFYKKMSLNLIALIFLMIVINIMKFVAQRRKRYGETIIKSNQKQIKCFYISLW